MQFILITLKTLSDVAIKLFPGSSAVEQTTVNRLAGGSNPSRGAILYKTFVATKDMKMYLIVLAKETININI